MPYIDIVDYRLVEYNFKRDEEDLRRQGQLCLYLEAGISTWEHMSHDMADVEIDGAMWTVLDFKEQRFVLLQRDSTYLLIDLDNVHQYGLLRFAEKATDDTAPITAGFHQQTFAMERLVDLWI